MVDSTEFEKKLEIIKKKFVVNVKSELNFFIKSNDEIKKSKKLKIKSIDDLRLKVHKIAGSAKTFSFPKLSDVCFESEAIIDLIKKDKKNYQDAKIIEKLISSLDKIINEISSISKESKSEKIVIDNKKDAEDKAIIVKAKKENATVILSIDDDELVTNLIETAFEDRDDISIEVAHDGKSGLAKAKKIKPALILLDVNMPKMNGYEVLKKLKSDPKTKDIAVLMLTRKSEEDNIIDGLSNGATDYLSKPFKLNDIVKKIDEVLQKIKNTILIADDDELILDLLKEKFYRSGYNVITTKNGKEAFRIIKMKKPSIVLLDIMMPGIDGFTVLRKVKDDKETKDIPVVFLSAKNQEENIVNGLKNGAYDYITKPISAEEVLARVESLLDRKNK